MKEQEINKMAQFEESYWWFVGRRKIVLSVLQKFIGDRKDLKILDVGCGTGGTTTLLKKFGTVYGIDFSMQALKFSSNKGLKSVLKSSVLKLPFKEETFDLITILDSLEHIKDDVGVLIELKKILKKDGIILIAVPAYQFLWSEHDIALSHFRRYNSHTLSKIIENAGLEKIWQSYAISVLFPFIALYRIIKKPTLDQKNAKSNLVSLSDGINNFLIRLLILESKIIKKISLPFGLSLLCIVRK